MYSSDLQPSSLRTADSDGLSNRFPIGGIIVIVIISLFGLLLCIGSVISIVYIIKHWNQPKHSKRQGQVVDPSGYYNSWSTEHRPSSTSVTNPNAVDYEVYRPTYIVLATDPTKTSPA